MRTLQRARRAQPTEGALRAAHFTIPDLWRRSARLYARRLAVVSEDVELTYAQLDERAHRLANAFGGLGLRDRDRIAVLAETRPEYIETYMAAAMLGVTLVALNIRQRSDELAHCLQLTRPRLLLASPGQAHVADELRDSTAGLEQLVLFPERAGEAASDYERLLVSASVLPPRIPVEPEDIHCILFTSGTTGRPKGAMISQRASVMRAARCADWFGLSEADGMIGWIPMFHTGGDECVKATFLTGGKFATFETVDPAAMFRAIEKHRLTWTAMLPGMITDFLHHRDRARHDLSSLRFGLGYANMMPQVVEEFTSTLGAAFWDTYGQTESSFVVALDLVRPGDTPSLRKWPAPLLDIRIVDGNMRELPDEVPGECVVRGPSVMSGYVEAPAATEEVFRGGWLHTGDILTRHEDGSYSYVDRLKYLIKTGGENVYPAEVEQVIASHPAVREACVVSVPDERWGETIKAVVSLDAAASLSGEEVRTWCRAHLPGFKCPRYVQFVATKDLPRSITGKILRHELEKLEATEDQRVAD
ncbi:MAG: class I adenylate-forming enzyme family protein [Thermoleophilaceae bacterium]